MAGGFHDVRLPGALEQNASGGPAYNTSVVTTLAGFEQRNSNWAMPRYRWAASIPYGDQDTFDALMAFFHARAGRLFGFRFRDPADNQAVSQTLWLDPTINKRRLAKNYTSGGVTLIRKITRPVSGTVTFTGGGTLDYTTGIITGNTGGTWTGTFDVPVRFDSDEFDLTMDQVDVGTAKIDLIEIRE